MTIMHRPGRYAAMLSGLVILAAALSPTAGAQAAVPSASPTPAQVRTLPLPEMLRGAATATGGASAVAVPPTVAPSASLNVLDGVFCTSRTRCWAVGGQEGAAGIANQVLRWNGTTWRKVSVPNPGGSGTDSVSELFAVRCAAAANCWAVGEHSGGGALLNEALHWNGKKWTTVRTPDPGGKGSGNISELEDSACVTSADCWAVGDFGSATQGPTEKRINQVLHWNGKKWTKTATPNPDGTKTGAGNQLDAATCLSSANCWAVGNFGSTTVGTGVGRNEALHWNGRKWAKVKTPNPQAPRPATSTNCWPCAAYRPATAGPSAS